MIKSLRLPRTYFDFAKPRIKRFSSGSFECQNPDQTLCPIGNGDAIFVIAEI